MKQNIVMMAAMLLFSVGLTAKGTGDADIQKVKEGTIGGYEVSIGKAYDTVRLRAVACGGGPGMREFSPKKS